MNHIYSIVFLFFILMLFGHSSIGQGVYLDYALTNPICTSATGKIEITNIKTSPAPFTFSLNGGTFRSGTTFDTLSSGFYTITIRDGFGLTVNEVIQLDTTNKIPTMELAIQNPSCDFIGGSIEITNVIDGKRPYELYFESQLTSDSIYTNLDAGFYQLNLIDGYGCEREQGAELVNQCIIPSQGFSPNGDGINDNWIITRIEEFPDCEIKVFNRYGQIVFKSTGYLDPWDGNSSGLSLPLGTYYYQIEITDAAGQAKQYTGSVAIVK